VGTPRLQIKEQRRMELTEADRGSIRQNAYFKWLDAGAPPGDGLEFWLEAESEYLHDVDDESGSSGLEPGRRAADWVSEANPQGRLRSRPDKELLIGSRG
jgi:hypothetical protein